MKKNKMMRIAAVLLIVTLLSTCAISGTFAKYVAKADVSDSARVAKWGIKIETSGDLFSDTYEAEDEAYINAGGTISVDAADDAKVVAPGTTSYTDDGMGFTARVYGKPEVATRFALKIATADDIFVPFGTYKDYTQAVVNGEEKTFTYEAPAAVSGRNKNYVAGYSPVKWDVVVTRVGGSGTSISLSEMASLVADQTFKELKDSLFTDEGVSITDAKTIITEVKRLGLEDMIMDKINEQFAGHGFRNLQISLSGNDVILSMDFDPNENVNYRFEGGWAWAFEQTAPDFITSASAIKDYEDTCDKLDTLLGNVADTELKDADDNTLADLYPDVKTNLQFKVEASATQID